MYFFFLHVQCCVRVSASNFEVLTRKSGGARAFGSLIRFLAGPARMQSRICSSSRFHVSWHHDHAEAPRSTVNSTRFGAQLLLALDSSSHSGLVSWQYRDRQE